MNIGIIVHSQSGTTKEFANRISEELQKRGHSVELTVLQTDIEVNASTAAKGIKFQITNLPNCKKYDIVLLGSPVWAFSTTPVIIQCLKQLEGLEGKKMIPFVTMGFPFKAMGGTRALSVISLEAKKAGANAMPGYVITKMFHNYKKDMLKLAGIIAATIEG